MCIRDRSGRGAALQVHFGTLASDGSAVAVKVACVGSKGKMLSDMRTMLRVAVALHRFGLDGGERTRARVRVSATMCGPLSRS